ncbi:synemin isoform X2 [Varanus komodoensis]|nr:synemin isoform X2 [Varanus komodoensis]
MIIEALEEEKQFLTTSIAGYLKDYYELLQVKAGLSLEIETYRALLEGESSQWILMWDEEHGRKLPQGVRKMLHEYSNRHSAYQQEKGKRAFPAIQNVDTRYKFPTTKISSSAAYSSRTKTDGTQAPAPGKTRRDTFRPLSAIRRDETYGKTQIEQKEIRTFPPRHVISRESEVLHRTIPERKKAETGSTRTVSKESTTVQKHLAGPTISENVKTKVGISTFPPYSLSSSAKEIKHESTIGGTKSRANEQVKDDKPRQEEKRAFPEGREKREMLAKERTASPIEKIGEKLAGGERNVDFPRKTEFNQGLDEKKHIVEEFAMKDNKKEDRLIDDKTSKERSYIRWEERIRIDTSGKNLPGDRKMEESHSSEKEKNVSMTRQSKATSEMPIQSEVNSHGQILRNNNVEVTLQDANPSVEKQQNEDTSKLSREFNQDELRDESSKVDSLLRESIAENIVSDILKGFVQKSAEIEAPLDTKATSFEKEKVSEDGKVKTKITIQSTVQDDLNVSDGFDLGDVKKVLEESKETIAQDVIEDINAGAKGMEGKGKRTVQVEIVEEPLGFTVDERLDFSTPFEVEEAEDTFPDVTGHQYYGGEEKAPTGAAKDLQQPQPSVVVSHVEEVAEGDDDVDEDKYFVSTPEEYPLGPEQDEGSIYGQIHIEEESTVKYSWQDEFLQGSQTRINEGLGSPEAIYEVKEGGASAFISKDHTPQEQVAHSESTVIEKEITIPPEFHESIKGLFSQESKDPKHQLKEALEKLEGTLPESVKQELSALTKESQADSSSLEVGIKKMEHMKKGGLVTIVAEVNLSQTLDSDQFDMEFLGKDVADKIKLPTPAQSEGGFDEYGKQEAEICGDGRNKPGADVSSTPWTIEEVSSTAKLVGPTEIRRTEHVLYEGPASESLEFGTADASQSIKEFRFSPEGIQTTEKIIYRGPVHTTEELSGSERLGQAQFSADIRTSKHTTLGSSQVVEEIVFEGPALDSSSTDSHEPSLQRKGPVETSRAIRHLRIDPGEVHTEQVVYEGPLAGFMEFSSAGDTIQTEESLRQIRLGQKGTQISDQVVYEESSHEILKPGLSQEGALETNTSVRRIKLSPKEFITEQIVFMGPTSEHHLEGGETEQLFSSEGTVRHIKLGPKEMPSSEHIMHRSAVSESSGISSPGEDILEEGSPTEISRSVRHLQLRPGETTAEQIVFHGPVAETMSSGSGELSPTDGPSENNRSVGHIKIGSKEASFTFQMDVTNVAGGGQEATIVIPSRKEEDARLREGTAVDDQRDTDSEQRSEEATFDQTVQLQRMVDQRSVIHDEKKIALLYLNKDEGEEDDDGPWF